MDNFNDRRIIEEYLPISKISDEARGESSATQAKNILVKATIAKLHRWWARRPQTTSRAAVYGALVPVARFRTDKAVEDVAAPFVAGKFVEELCVQNVPGDKLRQAQEHIREEYGRPARVLDMFAGGGAIPLEAARLGCETYAVELNPVAHIVELATLNYPARYGQELLDLVRRWSETVQRRARAAVGDLYPDICDPDSPPADFAPEAQIALEGLADKPQLSLKAAGRPLRPVAYLWTRTVPCPQCGAIVPLHKQTWLRQKKRGFVALRPIPVKSTRTIRYEVLQSTAAEVKDAISEFGFDPGNQSSAGEIDCPFCLVAIHKDDIKRIGREYGVGSERGIGTRLMAAVCKKEGRKTGKVYVAAGSVPEMVADDAAFRPNWQSLSSRTGITPPDEPIFCADSRAFFTHLYGLRTFADHFSNRQISSLFSFIEQVRAAYREMIAGGASEDLARAVTTYLAFIVDKVAERNAAICRWDNSTEKIQSPVANGKMPMVWDFPETNPFADGSGSWQSSADDVVASLQELVNAKFEPVDCRRASALSLPFPDEHFNAVVTDPPYYDSVPYANLADYFYVWLKRSIGDLYPEHFSGETSPTKQEAIMDKTRHQNSESLARKAYEDMMFKAFSEAHRVLRPGGAMVCIYAHKSVAGWATLIDALRRAGLAVTEAWPLDTESASRQRAQDSAALGASISIVARKRASDEVGEYESNVRPQLEQIVRDRVTMLWQHGFGATDLIIAAVGAGLRAFTRFASVEYANGEPVPSERFLAEVEGVVLDTLLEQIFGAPNAGVASVDPVTRFYVLWRYTYRAEEVDAEDAIVFAYAERLELANLCQGHEPLLVKKGKTYTARDFSERGSSDRLGLPEPTHGPVPLVDVLQRALWLMDHQPRDLAAFIANANPNKDRLRLVAQSLSGAALTGGQADVVSRSNVTTAPEQSAVSRLVANWRILIDESVSKTDPVLDLVF